MENLKQPSRSSCHYTSRFGARGRLRFYGRYEGPHCSASDDFEVSSDELNLMVALAKEIGFEGGAPSARIPGGGLVDPTVSLCRSVDTKKAFQQISEHYQAHTGIEPLLITRPGPGARLL